MRACRPTRLMKRVRNIAPWSLSLIAWLSGQTGCAHRPRRAEVLHQSLVAEPTLAPVVVQPSLALAPCDRGVGGVILHAPNVDLACGPAQSCGVRVPFGITNCTTDSINVRHMRVTDAKGRIIEYDTGSDGRSIAPGKSELVFRFNFSATGQYSIVATGDDDRSIGIGAFKVSNSVHDAAVASCKKSGGTLERLGMHGIEGCNRKTADGNKVCRDGDECESACLFERFEVIEPATTTRHAMGRPVGKCSGTSANFGCHAFIRRGASRDRPISLPNRANVTCVD